MGTTNSKQANTLGDSVVTASEAQIAAFLEQTPDDVSSLYVLAMELEGETTLWVQSADQVAKRYAEDIGELARVVREQCISHAASMQADCRYLIRWVGTEGQAMGTFQLRIMPRAMAGQRFTGSFENVIVQMQRHNEALAKTLVESQVATQKGLSQILEIQARTIEAQARKLDEQGGQGATAVQAELEALRELKESDEANMAKLMEIAGEILPLLASGK